LEEAKVEGLGVVLVVALEVEPGEEVVPVGVLVEVLEEAKVEGLEVV
jgi:hypothetical protein